MDLPSLIRAAVALGAIGPNFGRELQYVLSKDGISAEVESIIKKLLTQLTAAEEVIKAAAVFYAEDQPTQLMNENYYVGRGCLGSALRRYQEL